MTFLRVWFHPGIDTGPVKDYLDTLADLRPSAQLKILGDLEALGAEGLRSGRLSVRTLGGGLWELRRRFEGVQYRLFFCVEAGTVWLLHNIEKKGARTPLDDLNLAKRRMKRISP